jgi:hypothetical protein
MFKKMSKEMFIYLSAPQVRNHANMDYENATLVKKTKHLLGLVTELRQCANVNCRFVKYPNPENYDKELYEIVGNNDTSHKSGNNISIEEMNKNLRELVSKLENYTIPEVLHFSIPK